MTDLPDSAATARPAETFAEAEDALLSRWPETKLEPSLDRIRAFTELLGDPQTAYPVIHLTGTNG
jgi:dihydrofolate synthase/folylpolyglutamate synthase